MLPVHGWGKGEEDEEGGGRRGRVEEEEERRRTRGGGEKEERKITLPPLYQFNVMEVEMQGGVTFPSQVFLGRGGEEGGRVVGGGGIGGGAGGRGWGGGVLCHFVFLISPLMNSKTIQTLSFYNDLSVRLTLMMMSTFDPKLSIISVDPSCFCDNNSRNNICSTVRDDWKCKSIILILYRNHFLSELWRIKTHSPDGQLFQNEILIFYSNGIFLLSVTSDPRWRPCCLVWRSQMCFEQTLLTLSACNLMTNRSTFFTSRKEVSANAIDRRDEGERGGERRWEEAYRKISDDSNSLHPCWTVSFSVSFLPSFSPLCGWTKMEWWSFLSSSQISAAQRKRWLVCCDVNPHPPFNTSFSSSFPLSYILTAVRITAHTHTHTHTHTSHTLQPHTHTSPTTVATRNERLKPRQPDSILTLLTPPPLPAMEREREWRRERNRDREGEKERERERERETERERKRETERDRERERERERQRGRDRERERETERERKRKRERET